MYKNTKLDTSIIRKADGECIPFSEDNTDYQQYLAWLALGNTPDPYVATPAEIAAETERAKYIADATAAKLDVKLIALAAMTPAQARAWISANVTNLAEAKDALGTLAAAVVVLARRL